MEHESYKGNSPLHFLNNDALDRLEWKKITEYLASFSCLPHAKIELLHLSPWLSSGSRDFYFQTTSEMLELNSQGASLAVEIFDLDVFEKQLSRGAILSPNALYQIYIVLKLCKQFLVFFQNEKHRAARFQKLHKLTTELVPHSHLMEKLNLSIDKEGYILSSASVALASARSRLEHAKRKIVEHLEEILKRPDVKNALQDSIWMLKDGRYVLPVRTDRKSEVDGIPRGVSQSGSTVFVEPRALASQHALLEQAQIDIEIEEQRILSELSQDCFLKKDDILNSSRVLTTLDVIQARTKFAGAIEGVLPEFLPLKENTPKFRLLNAKHPLFLLEKKNCVENDLELKPQNPKGQSPCVWVLSGPNAGGKTVAMKTVGLSVLLAKAGLFVSCKKAQMIEFESIFVELGDRQNREEDLSTFSGHLSQIKKITEAANERSLILLDEGFVGTDPAIGVAMARATLEFFAEKKSTVIITTHFSNLKTLSDGDERFYNGSMEFEPKKLLPTYKVLSGIPGQSYAIELAERMGLSADILNKSRQYYGVEAQRMENLIKDLQRKREDLREELQKQEKLRQELDIEVKNLKYEREKISSARNELVENYRVRLQKRLNAYENRLDIRERQFEKQKEQSLKEIREREQELLMQESAPVLSSADEVKSIEKQNNLSVNKKSESKESNKPKKILSGFEALAKVKLSNKVSDSSASLSNLDTQAEKFRAPRYMTSRSLLDEARESLQNLNESFDQIEEDFYKDIDSLHQIQNKSKKQIKNATQTAKKTIEQNSKSVDFWKIGMDVKCDKFKEVGVVLRPADSKGFVECRFGIMKIKVSYLELKENLDKNNNKSIYNKPINKSKRKFVKKTPNSFDQYIAPVLQHTGNTIDLRGKTVDEALHVLDLELDKMNRINVERVVIIHGHGMGKIKEGVRKFLENASYKLRFRTGRQGEGGDGVTVVEFD